MLKIFEVYGRARSTETMGTFVTPGTKVLKDWRPMIMTVDNDRHHYEIVERRDTDDYIHARS